MALHLRVHTRQPHRINLEKEISCLDAVLVSLTWMPQIQLPTCIARQTPENASLPQLWSVLRFKSAGHGGSLWHCAKVENSKYNAGKDGTRMAQTNTIR